MWLFPPTKRGDYGKLTMTYSYKLPVEDYDDEVLKCFQSSQLAHENE